MRLVAAVLLATLCAVSPIFALADDRHPPNSQSSKSTAAESGVALYRSSCPCHQCWVARTANFRIQWCTSEANLRQLAERCERLVTGAKLAWLGDAHPQAWTPQCEVVVHAQLGDYVACVGPGSERTSGCATIRLDEGRVVARRIDLRSDADDWDKESLPHELMHVVLADHFSNERIPPWADEGIAMLAESPEKLKRRLTELRRVAGQGTIYSIGDLIGVRSRPQPAFRDAFNGQSFALVNLLLEHGTPRQCLEFVEASRNQDWRTALHNVYGNRLSDLEQNMSDSIWTERAARGARYATVSLQSQVAEHHPR
ncbi:MAG TPA: hypothetical protein VFG04_00955 [Planctomycetaceae bacterium]|jgi:hypothetical protein|nr:hypothetical protein [Planctomycetaceae bacterium]